MSTLVVDLLVSEGRTQQLCEAYVSVFRPAISRQRGFEFVTLLEPRRGARFVLLIGFASEDERLAWVASDDHQKAWPAIEVCCDHVEAATFDAVT